MAARRGLQSLSLRVLSTLNGAPGGAHNAILSSTAALHSTQFILLGAQRTALPASRLSLNILRTFAAAADLPPHTELGMPALSPTMSHGNIIAWKKQEGDSIQPGDIYCEVETDKATIEWEAQEEGYLARILVPSGTNGIEVGTPVAVVAEELDDIGAFKDYQPGASGASASGGSVEASAAPEAPSSAPEAASSGSGGSFPAHELLGMPALSPTMSMGNIIAWKKAAGDEVAPGDILAEVETDKATIEWEAQEEGFVAKIMVPDGATGIEVGAPVLVMVDDKEAVAAFEAFTAADAAGAKAPPATVTAPSSPASAETQQPAAAPSAAGLAAAAAAAPSQTRPTPTVSSGSRVIASPYAKKLAAEAGISLSGAGGSGPKGRIVAADVHQLIATGGAAPAAAGTGMTAGAAAAGAPAPSAPGGYTDEETTQIRKVIARRLLESKQQIPHYYLTVSCRVDKLGDVRQALNATLAGLPAGGKLSVNDFVIKASALALRRVPEVNASWHGDYIRHYHSVDCSVAVQTPAGLMVPIVRNADHKGLTAIAQEVRDLATRAKEGKLKPEEFTGGTFTVSNLGMFGVSQFAAIVNPPQACILAVGGAEKRVVPGANGGFEEGTFMNVTLSCDHRVVDGAVGAQWLQAFKGYIEDPASMLL